jgi:DNA-binding IclR family transcriptional regulator
VNSLHRLLRILDLFEGEAGVFTADQVLGKLGYTRSTTYRYLKVLSDSGLLSSWHGNGYALGPRFIEFATLIQNRDPLLLASQPEMRRLAQGAGGAVVLYRRYRDKMLCVHGETSASMPAPLRIGVAGPLFGNCASRVVLSHIRPGQLRKYYDSHGAEISAAGIGGSLAELRNRLKSIREKGYDVDHGADDEAPTSFAAPVIDRSGLAIASVALTVPTRIAKADANGALPRHVIETSQAICRAIAD